MMPCRSDCALIQHASDEFAPLVALTEAHHRAYCLRHGIDYRPRYGVNESRKGNLVWAKVEELLECLDAGYERVIWLDADTLIVDAYTDLRDGCPVPGIYASRHEGGSVPEDHYNMGTLYVHNGIGVREMLAAWLKAPEPADPWREQRVFNTLAGTAPHILRVVTLDTAYNATEPSFTHSDPVVRAWHGYGSVAARRAAMQQALDALNEREASQCRD